MSHNAVVIGLGKTGLSAVRYLTKRGYKIAVTDTRATPPDQDELQKNFPNSHTSFGALDPTLILNADMLVVSPGVSLKTPILQQAKQKGITLTNDIELFAQEISAPIVAITGTNAKSTVTTLVGAMAKQAGYSTLVAGNIGLPVLDCVDETFDLAVLELSSFQLELAESLLPRAATILNITPDHMDRYDDLTEYCDAKHRIYKNAGVRICNRQDALTKPKTPGETITFGADNPKAGMFGLREKMGETFLAFGEECWLSVRELTLIGQHNWMNALAALGLGHAIELPLEAMLTVLRTFRGLPHRCQFIRQLEGVSYYNDSKATNVGATIAALNGLRQQIVGQIVLIAGGLGKGADFSELGEAIQNGVRHVVLLGEAAPQLAELCTGKVPYEIVNTLENAVIHARLAARSGDAVLLAPACASWDMFKDYTQRGSIFAETVERLV